MNPTKWKETLDELKSLGYGVRVQHLRRWRVRLDGEPLQTVGAFHKAEADGVMLSPNQIFELDPKGGRTRCEIYNLDSNWPVVEVEIRVHPLDHYCKRTGREIALRVALRKLKEVSSTVRKHIDEQKAAAEVG